MIQLYNCVILANFAIRSTLISASNNGYFEIYDSKIYHNYAVSNLISEIRNVWTEPVLDNTQIYDNDIISSNSMISEFKVV